jgi:hypothetical protein
MVSRFWGFKDPKAWIFKGLKNLKFEDFLGYEICGFKRF